MDKYIIYSGTSGSYGFQGLHKEFPEKYKPLVGDLYDKNKIAEPGVISGHFCSCRFAPLGDAYLFSVIYKGCRSESEKRDFFSSVNWLISDEEADDMYRRDDYVKFFSTWIELSTEMLKERGYSLPDSSLVIETEPKAIDEEAEKAIVSAMCSAMDSAHGNKKDPPQVIMGRSKEQGLFRDLFAVLDTFPIIMRKRLSFYVGFATVSELNGVALAITSNAALDAPGYSGQGRQIPACGRITLKKGTFSHKELIPVFANEYKSLLPRDVKNRISEIFRFSTNEFGYFDYLGAVMAKRRMIYDDTLRKCLGQKAYDEFEFTEEEKAAIYAATLNTEPVPKPDPEQDPKITRKEKKRKCIIDKNKNKKTKVKTPKGDKRQTDNDGQNDRNSREKVDLEEELYVLYRACAPFLYVLLFMFVFALFCGITFLFGVYLIARLPGYWPLVAYGCQITATVFISMTGGFLLFSYIGKCIHRNKSSSKSKQSKR